MFGQGLQMLHWPYWLYWLFPHSGELEPLPTLIRANKNRTRKGRLSAPEQVLRPGDAPSPARQVQFRRKPAKLAA
jgi:hypothetical protein